MNSAVRSSKLISNIISGLVIFWMVSVGTGIYCLAYLRTQFSYYVRAYIVFPVLVVALIYFIFFHRRMKGPTGYQQRMNKIATRSGRLKALLLAVAGLLLIPGGIAWTSYCFPAWATELFAKNRYEQSFLVEKITERGGIRSPAVFDIMLRSEDSTMSVNLDLSRAAYKEHSLKCGERIVLVGRTWEFGTIVEKVVPSN